MNLPRMKFILRILWLVNFVTVINCWSSASRDDSRKNGKDARSNIEKRATFGGFATSKLSNIPTCSSDMSCKERCTNHTEWGDRSCYCDPDCYLVFNDCCTDYIKYCGPQKTVKTPTMQYNYSCEVRLLPFDTFCKCKGLWMVTQCTFGWPNDTVRENCKRPKLRIQSVQDIYGFLPVQGINGNTTFRNAYCAICNGITTFEPWRLDGRIFKRHKNGVPKPVKNNSAVAVPQNLNLTEKINFLLSHSDYITVKRHENAAERFCRTDIIDYCRSGRELHSCTYGIVALVSYRENVYKNINCATCHKKENITSPSCFSMHETDSRPSPATGFWSSSETGSKPSTPFWSFESLKVVLDRKPFGVGVKKQLSIISNKFENYPQVNMSLLFEKNPRQNSFYVSVRLQRPLNAENNFSFTSREFHESLAKHLNVPCLELFDTKTATALSPQGATFSNIVYSMIVQIPRKNLDLLFANQIVNSSSPETTFMNYIHFSKLSTLEIKGVPYNVTKAWFRPLLCLEETIFTEKEYILQQQGRVFVPSTNMTYEKHEYYNQTVEKNGQKRGNITVCERHLPTKCNGSMMHYTSEEYSVMTNWNIYVNRTFSYYSYGEYDILSNKSIGICQTFERRMVNKTSETIRDYKALGYITFISFLLSIISLIFLLVTYVIFPQLRTLPGKNLMNFAASLSFFMIFWLPLNFTKVQSNKPLCQTVAIIEHYFLMASFVSMSVIAFHTYTVFARNVPAPRMSNGRERKLFCRYLVLTWLLPALIVGICVVLDRQDGQKVGYGESRICWMSEPNAYIYFVIIPVGVLLLFNIVAFSITAVYLQKHSRSRAARQATGNRPSNLSIYAKLSTLMGFSWLFGLLALVVTSTMVFWYLFVIFTSLHGVFVAFAFIFNSKTFSLYKQKFVDSNSARAINL